MPFFLRWLILPSGVTQKVAPFFLLRIKPFRETVQQDSNLIFLILRQ